MPIALTAIQFTLLTLAFVFGGTATKAGGALLLASILTFGIGVGWWACGKTGGR